MVRMNYGQHVYTQEQRQDMLDEFRATRQVKDGGG